MKTNPKERKGNKTRSPSFPIIHPNAAGIDIGSAEHWVAVPEDRDEQPVRKFACFTQDLHAMAAWLKQCKVQTVAMESTGSIGSLYFKCWKLTASKSNWSTPNR